MARCYICDSTLNGESAQVCSSITPYSCTPYPEKIAGMMGEEYMVVVSPADQMCKRCSLLLNHVDRCEQAKNLLLNEIRSIMEGASGILPPDQAINDVEEPQQMNRLYKCLVCSITFDSQIDCADHIKNEHNELIPSTSNEARVTEAGTEEEEEQADEKTLDNVDKKAM